MQANVVCTFPAYDGLSPLTLHMKSLGINCKQIQDYFNNMIYRYTLYFTHHIINITASKMMKKNCKRKTLHVTKVYNTIVFCS